MATYGADQVLNKTLIAAKNLVAYYAFPFSSSKFNILAGHNIGVVYSYIYNNQKNLWWMFYDDMGKAFYVEHKPGLFDENSLKLQGAVSDEEKAKLQAEDKAKEDTGVVGYYIEKYGKPILLGTAAIYLVGKLIQGYTSRSKNG